MSKKFLLVLAMFVPFGLYSIYVLLQVGYLGLFKGAMVNISAIQVLLDLVIVCAMACAWMLHDAKAKGRNAWPYVLITLLAGSFGPMLYVMVGELRGREASANPATS